MRTMILSSLLGIATAAANAQTTSVYYGKAQDEKGKVSYLEKHTAEFDKNGDIFKAETDYTRESGEVFGKLKSDFSKSVTAPTYTFEDLRDGSSHGMSFDGQKYVLWMAGKDGKRTEKEFLKDYFDKDALVVGCQGLHYYLVKNLDSLRERKEVRLKYLIPGKLDYYTFILSFEKEDEKFVNLKVKVQNLFLRAFVSSLQLKYSKEDRRLVSYSGLSNIPTDSGGIQNVQIAYTLPPKDSEVVK